MRKTRKSSQSLSRRLNQKRKRTRHRLLGEEGWSKQRDPHQNKITSLLNLLAKSSLRKERGRFRLPRSLLERVEASQSLSLKSLKEARSSSKMRKWRKTKMKK